MKAAIKHVIKESKEEDIDRFWERQIDASLKALVEEHTGDFGESGERTIRSVSTDLDWWPGHQEVTYV